MKKAVNWILLAAFVVFCLDWAALGVKLLNGSYDILVEVSIGAVCWVVIIVCILLRLFSNRCPHCGKPIDPAGNYCPHCGKKLN